MIRSVLWRVLVTTLIVVVVGYRWLANDLASSSAWGWPVLWGAGLGTGLIWGLFHLQRLIARLTRDLHDRRIGPEQMIDSSAIGANQGSRPDYMWYPDDRGMAGLTGLSEELVQLQKSLWEGIYNARLAKDRFKVVLDSTAQALILIDRDRRIVLYNKAATATFPNLREGMLFHSLIADPLVIEQVSTFLLPANQCTSQAAGGERIDFVRRELFPERWFDLAVAAIPWHDPTVLLALLERTEAEKTRRLRQQFVANAAHELKTPLASLKLALEAISPEVEQAAEFKTLQRFFPTLVRATDQLQELVQDMLNLNRFEAAEADPPPPQTETDLQEVVADVLETQKDRQGDRKVEVELQMPVAPIDKDAATMILNNLVGNAFFHSPQGARVSIKSSLEPGVALPFVLQVRNTGSRVPERDLERVFERFYRVDSGRSRSAGGSGLGLSIVKHAVQRWRGTVGMRSWDPATVEVTVRFPVHMATRTVGL